MFRVDKSTKRNKQTRLTLPLKKQIEKMVSPMSNRFVSRKIKVFQNDVEIDIF